MRDSLFSTTSVNIPAAFFALAQAQPERVIYRQSPSPSTNAVNQSTSRGLDCSWPATTFRSVEARVSKLSAALIEYGISAGDKVAILSGTRPEWMEADLAILSAGAVSVSVYPTLTDEDTAYILYDSGTKVAIAENQEQVDKLLLLTSRSWHIPATEDRPDFTAQIALTTIIAIEQVTIAQATGAEGRGLRTKIIQLRDIYATPSQSTPATNYKHLNRDSLASLVYTSGTTGPPKGVMQSHGNHLANVRQAYASTLLNDSDSICLFLPLAHAFAKLMGYIGFLSATELRFCSIADPKSSRTNPAAITRDLPASAAAIFPVVPRLLEKIRDGVNSVKNTASLKGRLLRLTLWAAQKRFLAGKENKPTTIVVVLAFALTTPLRSALRKRIFGPNLVACLSGGAKLPLEVSEFFYALGIEILEGYGLTETVVATNVSRRQITPLGSVGPVMDNDIEMRLLEDGEIVFRGPNIAQGYFNRPTATKTSFDSDGWFYTGDYGSIDDKGNLYIVGRKKEIIVTSGGKNIAPLEIEEKIKSCSLVSQAILVGDGRKYCIAVVTLNQEEAARFIRQQGLPQEVPAYQSQDLHQTIWTHAQAINQGLASFETIKKIFIAPEDFSVENGLLTPTFKIKRNRIEQQYKSEIDALYGTISTLG